jgi:hypothetical protein
MVQFDRVALETLLKPPRAAHILMPPALPEDTYLIWDRKTARLGLSSSLLRFLRFSVQ